MPFFDSLFSRLEKKGGNPRELYAFARGVTFWRHTSSNRPVTVPVWSQTYTPALITRGRVSRKNEQGAYTVHCRVAVTAPIADELRRASTLPMSLSIARWQPADAAVPAIFALGEVAGVFVQDGWVEFDLVSGEARFAEPYPAPIVGTACLKTLGDADCGLPLAPFLVTTTIGEVGRRSITVDDIGTHSVPIIDHVTGLPTGDTDDGPNAAPWFELGTIIYGTGPYERQFVRRQVGNQLHVWGEIPAGVAAGDTVTLVPGDDKKRDTCRDKFNNVDRFNGFNELPTQDPLQTGIM